MTLGLEQFAMILMFMRGIKKSLYHEKDTESSGEYIIPAT